MKIISKRPDEAYIQKAWKYAELDQIEDHAALILGKSQDGQGIEEDLFCILYLAFRCGFETAVVHANNWSQTSI